MLASALSIEYFVFKKQKFILWSASAHFTDSMQVDLQKYEDGGKNSEAVQPHISKTSNEDIQSVQKYLLSSGGEGNIHS